MVDTQRKVSSSLELTSNDHCCALIKGENQFTNPFTNSQLFKQLLFFFSKINDEMFLCLLSLHFVLDVSVEKSLTFLHLIYAGRLKTMLKLQFYIRIFAIVHSVKTANGGSRPISILMWTKDVNTAYIVSFKRVTGCCSQKRTSHFLIINATKEKNDIHFENEFWITLINKLKTLFTCAFGRVRSLVQAKPLKCLLIFSLQQ